MAIKTLSYRRYLDLIKAAEHGPADHTTVPNGYSPGGAAALLGVSRQAISLAIREGRLDAFHIPLPDGRPGYYLIPQAALDGYKRRPHRKRAMAALGKALP